MKTGVIVAGVLALILGASSAMAGGQQFKLGAFGKGGPRQISPIAWVSDQTTTQEIPPDVE